MSSLNQISNFSSNSQWQFISKVCRAYGTFPFNHVKELELSHTVPNGKSKLGADFFHSDFKFTAIHSLK